MFNLDVLGYECPLSETCNTIVVTGSDIAKEHLIHCVLLALHHNYVVSHGGLHVYCQLDLRPTNFEHNLPYYPFRAVGIPYAMHKQISGYDSSMKFLIITSRPEILEYFKDKPNVFFLYLASKPSTFIHFMVGQDDTGRFVHEIWSQEPLGKLYTDWLTVDESYQQTEHFHSRQNPSFDGNML